MIGESPTLLAARHAIVDAGHRLDERGLVHGTSGNLSVRVGEGVVVTPAGCSLRAMQPDQLSVISLEGAHVSGPAPTSEVPLHLAVYRSTDAGAIAHVHAVASTAASCTCDELPALHYNVVLLGGAPRTAAYARYGTDALAANVVSALRGGHSAALMQNHGSLAFGADLSAACDRIELLEWLCELHLAAHRLGAPRMLGEGELAEVEVAVRRGGDAAR